MRDYSGIVMQLRLLAADLETAYGEERGSSLYSAAADAIEELLARVTDIDVGDKWINVEERLPSRYETVLLNIQTCKDSYVTIGDYEPNELRFRDFADRNNQVYCGDIVTHWMPLPAPPKGVE